MSMAQKIEDHIRAAIEVSYFEAINDSHKHAGHSGDNGTGESHFRIILSSPELSGMSRVQSQRIVMNAIKPLFDKGLHAFSLKINTP